MIAWLRRIFGRNKRQPVSPVQAAFDGYLTDYLQWAAGQTCIGCGKRAADRPRDAQGRCTDMWIHEYLCEPCWRAGVRGEPADSGERFRRGVQVPRITR